MSEPHILVIEDDDAISTLIQYNLEKEGYDVAVAGDGEEGLMQSEERLPDLVVLDWMLPKVSGIEVCRRLRSRPESRNVPIIMLTARGEESDRVRGLDVGADDYLTKPFSVPELNARIRAVLRRMRPGLADDRLSHGDIVVDRVPRLRVARCRARGRQVLPRWGRSRQGPGSPAGLVSTRHSAGRGRVGAGRPAPRRRLARWRRVPARLPTAPTPA